MQVPDNYWALSSLADLPHLHRPYIMFLFVKADVCRRLPSDSVSPRTPLSLAVAFPLSGRLRDLHPLEYAHAGRTSNSRPETLDGYLFYTYLLTRMVIPHNRSVGFLFYRTNGVDLRLSICLDNNDEPIPSSHPRSDATVRWWYDGSSACES